MHGLGSVGAVFSLVAPIWVECVISASDELAVFLSSLLKKYDDEIKTNLVLMEGCASSLCHRWYV